jgi:acetylornithine deacetylase
MDLDACHEMAVGLVKELIRIPSLSREEEQAADLMEEVMKKHGFPSWRKHNNVWAEYRISDKNPNILLLPAKKTCPSTWSLRPLLKKRSPGRKAWLAF